MTDLNKDDRSRLRPIVGAVIAASLFGALILWSVQAFAEEVPLHVHEQDGLTIRLMPGLCVDPRVMEMILTGMPTLANRFKAIESKWRMRDGTHKDFRGCWAEMTKEEVGDASFMLIFEDGDYYLVPKSQFGKPAGSGA